MVFCVCFLPPPSGDACEWKRLVWAGSGLVQSNGAQQDILCQILPTGAEINGWAVLGKGKARSYEVLDKETVSLIVDYKFRITELEMVKKERHQDLLKDLILLPQTRFLYFTCYRSSSDVFSWIK